MRPHCRPCVARLRHLKDYAVGVDPERVEILACLLGMLAEALPPRREAVSGEGRKQEGRLLKLRGLLRQCRRTLAPVAKVRPRPFRHQVLAPFGAADGNAIGTGVVLGQVVQVLRPRHAACSSTVVRDTESGRLQLLRALEPKWLRYPS